MKQNKIGVTAFILALVAAGHCAPTAAAVSYWFSFGDSYTSTGFNPNGTQPAVGNPLGNPAYPGQTVGGGPTWIDIVTEVSNTSTILTYNYAISGSVVDKSVVNVAGSTSSSLVEEVQTFTTWDKAAKQAWTSADALFSTWFGINDIGQPILAGHASSTPSALNGDVIDHYFIQIQNLYNLGARNFLFLNVPPADRAPLFLGQSSTVQAKEKSQILDFNTKLAAAVTAFRGNHTGVQTFLWDSHTFFTTVLNSPTTYGFKDATSYGTGSQYFWGNNYHPSGAAHLLFGKQISALLHGTAWA